MKLALVGESYALRSPAAAVQQTLNFIPQFFDDLNEQMKNKGMLVGDPGFHLMGNLNTLGVTAGQLCRGIWSGGGRCFIVTDTSPGSGVSTLWEIGLNTYVGGNPSTGHISVISQAVLPGSTADGNPAVMVGNGNQLLIIKNGATYIDNGTGPVLARLQISGTVNTANAGAGGTVTWVSGDEFPTTMSSGFITIDGVNYTITARISATSLTIGQNPGTQTGASFTAPAGDLVTAVGACYLDTYFVVQRPVGQYKIAGTATSAGTTITWVSGDFFDELEVGQSITFDGLPFLVDTIVSPTQITVTTSAGALSGQAFSALVGPDLGRQFNISAPDDGTSWDPLDFATKEGYPDHIVSILANDEQLYLLGEESTETWQDTGNQLFPFQRINGSVTKEGNIAQWGPVAMNEAIYYIGGSPRGTPVCYRLDGYRPTRISTHAIEAAMASGIDTPSGAIAYPEIHDGHQFWVINFPGSLLSWLYDETASQQAGSPIWHQRAAWNGAAFTSYLLKFHTFVPEWGPSGMHVSLDYTGANVHEVNLNYFDDNGGDQGWVRTFNHLYATGKQQYFGRLTLEFETGSTVSNVTPPQVTRDYSDDRGNTFGNAVQMALGTHNQFAVRVYYPVNGSSRDRVFRLSGAGQYRRTFIDADLEYEVGAS